MSTKKVHSKCFPNMRCIILCSSHKLLSECAPYQKMVPLELATVECCMSVMKVTMCPFAAAPWRHRLRTFSYSGEGEANSRNQFGWKNAPYPLNMTLDGTHTLSGRFPCPVRNRFLRCSARGAVPLLTELSWVGILFKRFPGFEENDYIRVVTDRYARWLESPAWW
jgi:hypothetical protein